MAYTARRVAGATKPWPLVIGTRTYWARPLSAAFALRVLPSLTRPDEAPAAIAEAFRAAFPRPRLWWRDPVRQIAQLDAGVRGAIVAQLFSAPGESIEEQDPLEAVMAAHRKLARPQSAGVAPTLALMALTCEARLPGWYYAPGRWPTSDGYAPLAAVWTAYEGLAALDAQTLLHTARAMRIAQGSGTPVELDRLQRTAYPADPTMRGRH